MKTLITTLFLIISLLTFGQEDRSVGRIDLYAGFDVANAMYGGKILTTGERRNNNALDLKVGANINYDWWRWGVYAETFPTINYFGLGMQFGTPLRIENGLSFIKYDWQTDIVIIPSVQGQYVWREGLQPPKNVTITQYFNWGLALEIQFDQIFRNSPFYVSLEGTLTQRSDKYSIWGRGVDPSGTIPALWENRAIYLNLGFEIFRD